MDLWEELRGSGLRLDAAAFCAAAGAYAANGQLGRARGLLSDMPSCGLSPGARMCGSRSASSTHACTDASLPRRYNVLLTAAGRERDLQALEALVHEMQSTSLKPNEATHGALVHGLVRCGELERAAAALRAARNARPAAGVQAYTALVQGFLRAGQLDRALAVVADMRADGVPPNVVTFSTLADGLVRLERFDEACALLSQMAAERVPANAVTYNTLLRGYAQRGDVQAGLELLHAMGAAGVRPSDVTFNTLLSACVRAEDMGIARQVLTQMREAGHAPDAVTYTTLLTGYGRAGQVDEARAFFAELLSSPMLRPDTAAFNAMLSLLAAAGEPGEDEALLSRMIADGVPADVASYGGIVAGRARRGDLDGAFAAYDSACRRGIEPDDRMFDSLLDACVRCGRFDRATSVLADMDARGVAPDRLKYRRLLQELYRTRSSYRGSQSGARAKLAQGQGLGRRGSVDASRQIAIELERFKFWCVQWASHRVTKTGKRADHPRAGLASPTTCLICTTTIHDCSLLARRRAAGPRRGIAQGQTRAKRAGFLDSLA